MYNQQYYNQGVQMPNVQMVQVQYIEIQNGMQKLNNAQGIFIEQRFEVIQALTGCQTPNIYKIFPADVNGQQLGGSTIFKAKEQSNCCVRQCLHPDCRPFNMAVTNQQGAFDYGNIAKTSFLSLERPFKCTCCCFNRPYLSVTVVENGVNQYVGKIRQPWKLCDLAAEIEDAAGNLKYIVEGSCCQLGYLCMGCPCQSCQEYTFEIKNANGEVLTRILKKSAGCMKACFGKSDNFSIGFPQGSSAEDKILFMAAALFLDYMYFENKNQNDAQNDL